MVTDAMPDCCVRCPASTSSYSTISDPRFSPPNNAAISSKSSRIATMLASLLITSQIPIPQWYDIIGNSTLADAILDRIVHNAYRIELRGETLRDRIDDTIDRA